MATVKWDHFKLTTNYQKRQIRPNKDYIFKLTNLNCISFLFIYLFILLSVIYTHKIVTAGKEGMMYMLTTHLYWNTNSLKWIPNVAFDFPGRSLEKTSILLVWLIRPYGLRWDKKTESLLRRLLSFIIT
jgi:hypothetical protein